MNFISEKHRVKNQSNRNILFKFQYNFDKAAINSRKLNDNKFGKEWCFKKYTD